MNLKPYRLSNSLLNQSGAIFRLHCKEKCLDLLPSLKLAVKAGNESAVQVIETLLREYMGIFDKDTTPKEVKAAYRSSRKCHYTNMKNYKNR